VAALGLQQAIALDSAGFADRAVGRAGNFAKPRGDAAGIGFQRAP